MPTTLLAHEPARVKDTARFFTQSEVSGIWGSGPFIPQSERAEQQRERVERAERI